ncbi:T9SS type A sorting domain-containing protein [Antarcticibacterium sp. 1MA-6-2]|uniref:T9SS type A sorting domain-containing protein n=1 Tax=Antarcticibacterium sp. 1MA-6-2 TaxID=2908210 RepID=UPI001F35E06C|nr:T9SS type A sorting domain-containing protein [Antarcticibacterium sp. 1MA-6-2]UJH91700.1 T9SS type A sorting domain-containing protein [Antarcticibacterium sp. 1MA-6-2]
MRKQIQFVSLTYSPQQDYIDAGTYSVTIASAETENYLSASKDVTLVIDNAEISGVTFEDDTFTYDGSEHSIFVTGLPEGATVSYDNNSQINAGTYTVKATVRMQNRQDEELTALMTINKATQVISFSAIPEKNLPADSDFQLNAISSSGLLVDYTYSYQSSMPAAEVTNGGFVRLLQAGEISITATQPGSNNYETAAPVTRILKINSSVAQVLSISINGEVVENPSAEIYYLMECGNDEDEVAIQLAVNSLATVDGGNSFTLSTPAPGIYNRSINVSSPDGSVTNTYNIRIERRFTFDAIVEQKFNNLLLINNNPETNGGYKFVSFEWYKNDRLVSTEQYFSEGNNAEDQLDPTDRFYLKLTTVEGEVLQTCQTSVQVRSSYKVTLAPNPVSVGEQLQLFADFPAEELKTMEISIHNLSGVLLKNMASNQKITSIDLPAFIQSGVYVLTCKTSKSSRTIKFIVK